MSGRLVAQCVVKFATHLREAQLVLRRDLKPVLNIDWSPDWSMTREVIARLTLSDRFAIPGLERERRCVCALYRIRDSAL